MTLQLLLDGVPYSAGAMVSLSASTETRQLERMCRDSTSVVDTLSAAKEKVKHSRRITWQTNTVPKVKAHDLTAAAAETANHGQSMSASIHPL